METFKVGELKSKFSHILQRVQAGEAIIISFGKKDKKIAVLVPYDKYISDSPRPLGILKGKAKCKKGIALDDLPEFASKMNFDLLSLSAEDAASSYLRPKISHKDPFDRMLIWQAIREKMVLISKDRKIAAYEDYGLRILPIS